jgi:hypothetical protein
MPLLLCKACQKPVKPDEPMLVISVGTPSCWLKRKMVEARLVNAPARWHYRCAPEAVRQYASVIAEADAAP